MVTLKNISTFIKLTNSSSRNANAKTKINSTQVDLDIVYLKNQNIEFITLLSLYLSSNTYNVMVINSKDHWERPISKPAATPGGNSFFIFINHVKLVTLLLKTYTLSNRIMADKINLTHR